METGSEGVNKIVFMRILTNFFLIRFVRLRIEVTKITAWRYVRQFCTAFNQFVSTYIKWPTANECITTSQTREQRLGFSGVIGAADGTHINIPASKRNPQSYIHRKGKQSISLEVSQNIYLQKNKIKIKPNKYNLFIFKLN